MKEVDENGKERRRCRGTYFFGNGRSRWREGLADGEDQEERGRCLRKEVLKSEGW